MRGASFRQAGHAKNSFPAKKLAYGGEAVGLNRYSLVAMVLKSRSTRSASELDGHWEKMVSGGANRCDTLLPLNAEVGR